jgi:outer membrane protein assembly factor BamB
MKKINCLFAFTCLLFICCTVRMPSWQSGMFHADKAHTGVYDSCNFKKFGALQWRFKTNGRIFSSPVIVDGTVYVGSEDSNCYAIDVTNGVLKWKFSTGGAVSSSPAVVNNAVYFTSYDGNCYAVDRNSGKEIWKFKTGGEKKVGAKGLWTMKPEDMYMEDLWDFFLSSPVVELNNEPTVYFGSSDGNLYALDAQSGKEKWKFKTHGIIHTSPALHEGTLYFGSWDTFL